MKKFLYVISTLVLLIAMAEVGRGQVAAWDFTGVGSTSLPTFAATTFNSGLVSTSGANNITRGSTAAWSDGSNSFRTTGFKDEGISTSNTDYFQITLTAATGYTVSLSTIDAKFGGTTTFYASPGVTSQFAYSLDGTNFTLIGSPVQSTSLTMSQIGLTGISALQNVEAGATITIRYYASGQTATGGWGFFSASSAGTNGLAIGGSVSAVAGTPVITVDPTSRTGFSYVQGSGPSAEQSFTISGSDLTVNISITPPTDYEISTETGGSFSATSPITLTQSGGTVSTTTIYVRLKAGLSAGNYNSESVTASSSGASNSTISCSGTVLPNSWINEIHYDNASTDVNERVEVVIENAGDYTLSDFTITLYNLTGGVSYDSETLNNFVFGSTVGNFSIYYNTSSSTWNSGIQNGPNDGVALSYKGNLIQFLSYEGTYPKVS